MSKASTSEPIDYNSALERTGGDREFLDELLAMYFEDLEDKYPQIKKALETRDTNLTRELAHSLKGSSANLSLIPLQNLFFQLEKAGRDNNLEDAESLLAGLKEEYKRLRGFLKKKDLDNA